MINRVEEIIKRLDELDAEKLALRNEAETILTERFIYKYFCIGDIVTYRGEEYRITKISYKISDYNNVPRLSVYGYKFLKNGNLSKREINLDSLEYELVNNRITVKGKVIPQFPAQGKIQIIDN